MRSQPSTSPVLGLSRCHHVQPHSSVYWSQQHNKAVTEVNSVIKLWLPGSGPGFASQHPQACNYSSRGSNTLFWCVWALCIHDGQRKHPHAKDKNKILKVNFMVLELNLNRNKTWDIFMVRIYVWMASLERTSPGSVPSHSDTGQSHTT